MRKVSQNDPCPCGSGMNYTRCCLEKDEANNVTRIVPDHIEHNTNAVQTPLQFNSETVQSLVEEKLMWDNELYQSIGRNLVANMSGQYDWELVGEAVCLWNSYSNEVRPVIKKVEVFPAAIEYFIAQVHGKYDVTQSLLAQKYGVSESTISQRAQQLLWFAAEWSPERNVNDEPIDHPHASRISRKEEAQTLLFHAWDEPSDHKRVQLARKALELYPDSPEAYTILAESEADTLEEAAMYYKQGMLAGERDLREAFMRENKGHFWMITSTRPYMLAKLGYATSCWELGKFREALKQYEELLDLNPNDNQGVRYLLLAAYIETGQFPKAEQLVERYQDDQSANFLYNRVLIEYGLNGNTAQLHSLMKKAKKQNRYVIDYLLGKQRIPEEIPEYIGFGDRSEAIDYIQNHIHLWNEKPELLRLLANL
ncbi:tetratricopeptide repeat protein [Brevibacillus sp. H7]|uniref:tetratricopeptide repeat protein n=1 Tax=Brevibacillus sp. H7 TaxID=3349138 RepID=UPI00381FB2E2